MQFSHTWKLILTASVLAVWAGCGESDVSGDGKDIGVFVETSVTPQILIAGQTANVSCPVFDSTLSVLDRPTRFTVTPNVAPLGNQITPTTAGKYEITCALDDGSLFDTTPATLLVIGPDDVDKVVVDTLLDKAQVAIDEKVEVSCGVSFDGEALHGLVTVVEGDPTEGLTIDDHTVSGQVDGDFDIACRVPSTDFRDSTPARLVVGEGGAEPAKVVTILDPAVVAAGDNSNVTCTVTDEDGQILDVPTSIEAPPGVAVVGATVQGQQVGEHEITCRIEGDTGTIEHVPATLTVTHGASVSIEAWADPLKAVYRPGDLVTIKWQGIDEFNNPVPNAPGTVTPPGQGVSATPTTNEYKLLQDAYLTFTVTLDAGPSTEVDLTVDGHGPEIAITSPERGLTFDNDGQILVTGTVFDNFGGIQTFSVNGIPVTPDETGNWSFQVSSVHGLNPVVVTSTDKHDNSSTATVSWYYSTGWVTTDKATPDDAWLEDTVRVWFAQDLIDDGDHTEPKVDDLAHLLATLLTNVDVAQMLGKPVLFEQNYPDVVNTPDFEGTGVHLQGDLKIWAEIDQVLFGDAAVTRRSRWPGR